MYQNISKLKHRQKISVTGDRASVSCLHTPILPRWDAILHMKAFLSYLGRPSHGRDYLHRKSNWQFWVGCGHWDHLCQTISLIFPCYSYVTGHAPPVCLLQTREHPWGWALQREMCWQASLTVGNGIIQWVMVAIGHRIPGSPFLFNQKYHHLVHLICFSFVNSDLSVIPEGEILEQIRESPFLSDLKRMFLWLDLECGKKFCTSSQGFLFICIGFLLIFRKFACSSTKMRIRGQQLFTVFELKNLTQEISFTWSLHLSISTCRKRSMNNNCHFRVAPLQLFIWLCVFPEAHVIGSDTKNQIAGF